MDFIFLSLFSEKFCKLSLTIGRQMNFSNSRFPTPKTSVKGKTFSLEFVDFVVSNGIHWNEKATDEKNEKSLRKTKKSSKPL